MNGSADPEVAAKRTKPLSTNFSPGALLAAITKVAPQFKGFRQQDSHELYIALTSAVHDEYVAKIKESESSEESEAKDGAEKIRDMAKPFEGSLLSVIQCKNCNQQSFKMDEIYDLSVHIPSANYTRAYDSPKSNRKT